ncbi:MAG: hypothetical protein U1E15_08990 [Hyphomicrobiales bacterium]
MDKIGDYDIALTEAIVDPNAATAATGDTDYAIAMRTLSDKVGKGGDGSSSSKPRKACSSLPDGDARRLQQRAECFLHLEQPPPPGCH